MKKKIAVSALAGSMAMAGAGLARADVTDSWITTKATIVLLTADGFRVKDATIGTTDGKVTMRGTVASEADRMKAERTVLKVNGVKGIDNQLEIASANKQDMPAAVSDADVKAHVEASLKSDAKMKDVTVASVTDGVVLLSGRADSLDESLRAIQNAYRVPGVSRVGSDITTAQD
jgi:osmotically-inducible protein OsmY